MPQPGGGNAADAAKAMRSVRIGPAVDQAMREQAKTVRARARRNIRSVPGNWSRSLVKLNLVGNSSVELSGILALVGEYGMGGAGWMMPLGPGARGSRSMVRVYDTGVPPPRAVRGRPKPEDGYILGKAWKASRDELTAKASDDVWDAYAIQFDRNRIYKVRG